MHHHRAQGFGPNIGSLDETIGKEERRHEGADAAEQGGDEGRDRPQGGKASQADMLVLAPGSVPIANYNHQKYSQEPDQRGGGRSGKYRAAYDRGGHSPYGEPPHHGQRQFAKVEPDPREIAHQLGNREDRDGISYPEGPY